MSKPMSLGDDNKLFADSGDPESLVSDELKDYDQWLCWEEVEDGDRSRKLPRVPDGSWDPASTNDPSTWGTFEEAHDACESREGVGVGFVLTKDDPYLVVDFDGVRDPETGEVEDWVMSAVDRFDSFTEISPSGTGLHVWLKDVAKPEWWSNTKEIDVYDSGQYITVTGDHAEDTPLSCTEPSRFEDWLEGKQELTDLVQAVQESPDSDSTPDKDSVETEHDGVDIDVYDVLSRASYSEEERVSHPYHGSKTGSNFQVFEGGETWHCYRHETTGNALHLIGVEKGVIDCGDWEHGGLTDREWARIFDAGREAGYDLPEPPEDDASQDSSAPKNIAEAIVESPSKWIDPVEQTIVVRDVGDQSASDLKQLLEERELDDSEAMEILTELEPEFTDAFGDFWNQEGNWTVRVASADDKWDRVREFYDTKGMKLDARNRAVKLLREEYDFVTLSDNDQMYCYNPETGIYEDSAERVIKERLEEMLRKHYSRREANEILARLRSGSYIDREDFGQDGARVCVENGVVDLTSGELLNFSPSYYFRSRLPVEYDESADCPDFKQFLEDVCPDDKIRLLQEFVGYCLQPRTHHKKALLVLGPTDAGKSVFLDVLQALFGSESTANLSVQYLANERWGEAELVGRMVNIRHDLDSMSIDNAGKVKELTAGNPVRAERKNQDPFRFQPRTKHIFAANEPPQTSADDDGFWNRWLTVVFPERIPREEQDTKLSQKLTTDEELSGLLNWAIEGYQRLEEQGRFTNEPLPDENRHLWEQYGDSVERFISQHLDRESGEAVRKDEAYARYEEFAKARGLEVASKHNFTSTLKDKGSSVEQRRFDGERKRVYTGFALSE